jgi:hypothetical protein
MSNCFSNDKDNKDGEEFLQALKRKGADND